MRFFFQHLNQILKLFFRSRFASGGTKGLLLALGQSGPEHPRPWTRPLEKSLSKQRPPKSKSNFSLNSVFVQNNLFLKHKEKKFSVQLCICSGKLDVGPVFGTDVTQAAVGLFFNGQILGKVQVPVTVTSPSSNPPHSWWTLNHQTTEPGR